MSSLHGSPLAHAWTSPSSTQQSVCAALRSAQLQPGVLLSLIPVLLRVCCMQAFAAAFNQRLKGNSWRITNASDIVPR